MIEKVFRLMSLVFEIQRSTISDLLVIKGGTAINYIYFSIPRLSEDIDFDYVGSVTKEKMEKDREEINKVLISIFKNQGYDVEHRFSYIISKFELRYEGVNNNKDMIKVDINFLKRCPVLPIIKKEFKHLFNFQRFSVNTYTIEELLAGKLSALIQRQASRDLFDIYNLEKTKIDEALLKKLFIFYSCMNEDIRKIKLADFISITPKTFKDSLSSLLPKTALSDLDLIKAEVMKTIKPLFILTKQEKEFVSALYDDADFKPELLFDNFSPELTEHPAIKLVLKKIKQIKGK